MSVELSAIYLPARSEAFDLSFARLFLFRVIRHTSIVR